jgi:hypothetical protein
MKAPTRRADTSRSVPLSHSEEAAEEPRAPSAAQQRIKAGCPPNSEMELESELEDALGESARSDQLPA